MVSTRTQNPPPTAPADRGRRPRRRGAAFAAVAVAALGAPLTAPAAVAAPAPVPGTTTWATPGTFSATVPDGVCSVRATVLGAAGGAVVRAAEGGNGAGASVSATFAVLPGTPVTGTVGGGGGSPSGERPGSVPGAGGLGGGGTGGLSQVNSTGVTHHGAGGGGLSSLTLGPDLAVLAGGGGGGGGWHSAGTPGRGGDAGLPTAPGATPGQAGADGQDAPGTTVTGGGGGGATAGGAGGTNDRDAARAGSPGGGRTGGAGASDANPDAGGGGGAGLFGGGGGASTTIYDGYRDLRGITGGGGGGGSSFVAPAVALGGTTTAPTDVASTAGQRRTDPGPGADGSVDLEWLPCAYDLAVTKTAAAPSALVGDTLAWTVTVTNQGPDAMTRGDVVDLADTLGAGTATLTGVAVSGGSSTTLARDPLTCDAAVGAPLPATLVCSRPFAPLGGTPSGTRGLDVGETLTVTYTQPATAPGEVVNTVTVTDRTDGDDDDTATTTTPVVGTPAPDAPVAEDDEDLDNVPGSPVTLDVVANDGAGVDPTTVQLLTPGTGVPVTELVVPGEGTWTVDPATGEVTFTPESGFRGDPTPVDYRVADDEGLFAEATVTVTYLEAAADADAVDDESLGNVIGTPVTLPVLDNDTGTLDPATLALVDPVTGDRVDTLTVPGEGVWTAGDDGTVTFTPEAAFEGNPTPVDYVVTSTDAGVVSATVTVTYLPVAEDDSSTGNVPGSTVTVPVVDNDAGDLEGGDVQIVDPATGTPSDTVVVPGEGTWTADGAAGTVTFTPEPGFTGDPTPVEYVLTDAAGATDRARVTIGYVVTPPLTAVDPVPGAGAADPGTVTPGRVPGRTVRHLAATGSSAVGPVVLAAGLLAAGAAMVAAVRRRRA
ncbi:Ig-like domain-containing protein [Cellulomonas endophytica]|uniref:Ig-like domain-containing protein n=1 Tax=Cellulomonas endophytica TaxID=2494735 RepID=UPI0010107F99|nr:DUF11 domain-containing protein [Cellulomonas endophytica]